jgi:outer membrane protein TolC
VVDPRQAFGTSFVPADEPRSEPASWTQSALLDEAFRQRGELFAARQAVKNAEVALEVASDARKPDLSVVGSVGIGGLGSKWTSAQAQLARDIDDQHRWTAGLQFSIPLDNRAAHGGYEKARLALDEAKLVLRSLELQVTEEVRNALRNLDASAKRLQATRRASELARDQLAAGEKRLASGLSTAFEVLRLQTDLAAAQNAEIAAAIGYRTSVVRVQLSAGSLFVRYVGAA